MRTSLFHIVVFIAAATAACVSLSVVAATPVDDESTSAPIPESNLVQLNYSNFDEYTSQGTWIIEFHAPWCGHCNRFAPEYAKAARDLKHLAHFGQIDGPEERGLMARFDVEYFPTLYHLKDGDVRKYTGGRTRDGLQRYLEESWKKVKPYGGLWGPDGTISRIKAKVIASVMNIVDLHEVVADKTGIPKIGVLFTMMLAFICLMAFAIIGLAVYLGDTNKRKPE